MAQPAINHFPGLQRRAFETLRRDAWWVQPLVVFLGLLRVHRLLHLGGVPGRALPHRARTSRRSTRRSSSATPHSWFGGKPAWWPGWFPWSAAFFILWAPGGFRLTCYYYRGAYYKAFWADPPSLHRRGAAQDATAASARSR